MSKPDEQIERESSKRIAVQAKKALPPHLSKGGGEADWKIADPVIAMELVCRVAVQGGAVRYGYTRDGGAYSIGLYIGQDSKTYYCNEAEGINEKLAELVEYFGK